MKIGVYGSAAGAMTGEIRAKAREIGRQIAKKGHTIITGACNGLPYEAVLGAGEFDGKCVGFSPAANLEDHKNRYDMPIDGFSRIIFVPENYIHIDKGLVCKKYRNISSVTECDAAIIIGGRTGSMNEFTIAYDLGKNIGVLEGSGGVSDEAIKVLLKGLDKQTGTKVIFKSDPVELVNKLIKIFN